MIVFYSDIFFSFLLINPPPPLPQTSCQFPTFRSLFSMKIICSQFIQFHIHLNDFHKFVSNKRFDSVWIEATGVKLNLKILFIFRMILFIRSNMVKIWCGLGIVFSKTFLSLLVIRIRNHDRRILGVFLEGDIILKFRVHNILFLKMGLFDFENWSIQLYLRIIPDFRLFGLL